jgi:hypothetical protein
VPVRRKSRWTRRRLAAIGAAALALAGGAVAAVTAVGAGSAHARHARHARLGARAVGGRDLAAAAAYLGVPVDQLIADLHAGKSLSQIADATPGKSSSGLIAALVSARRERLSALGARVTQRVSAEVNRSGPGSVREGRHRGGASAFGSGPPSRLGAAAAAYLGVSPAQLQSELRSGRTLAEIANATHGRSANGLINALVSAKREALSAVLGRRRLTAARAGSIEARLLRRFSAIVNRSLPAR